MSLPKFTITELHAALEAINRGKLDDKVVALCLEESRIAWAEEGMEEDAAHDRELASRQEEWELIFVRRFIIDRLLSLQPKPEPAAIRLTEDYLDFVTGIGYPEGTILYRSSSGQYVKDGTRLGQECLAGLFLLNPDCYEVSDSVPTKLP